MNKILMPKMSHACEDHSQAIFVSSFDRFLITDRVSWLDDGFNACFGDLFHVICKREEGIGSKHSAVKAIFGLFNGNTNRSHTVGLAWANAKCHVVIGHDESV